jgi:hypothetical protein
MRSLKNICKDINSNSKEFYFYTYTKNIPYECKNIREQINRYKIALDKGYKLKIEIYEVVNTEYDTFQKLVYRQAGAKV